MWCNTQVFPLGHLGARYSINGWEQEHAYYGPDEVETLQWLAGLGPKSAGGTKRNLLMAYLVNFLLEPII